jgi:hypothetical protein
MTYERNSLTEKIENNDLLLDRLQENLCSNSSLKKEICSTLYKRKENPREGSIEIAKPNFPVKTSTAEVVRFSYANEGFTADNNGDDMVHVRRGFEKYFIFITERDSSYKLNIMKTVL